jgi:hypothetical protein
MEIRFHGILSFLNPAPRAKRPQVERIERPMDSKLPEGFSLTLVTKVAPSNKAIPRFRARAKK